MSEQTPNSSDGGLTLADVAAMMRDLDTCVVTACADGSSRPMSNNRDVDYDGTSRFFAWEGSGLVTALRENPAAAVTFQGEGVWIALSGDGRVTTDRDEMAAHWDPDIDRWFEQGVDTPGVAMVVVEARRLRWWTFERGDGELDL